MIIGKNLQSKKEVKIDLPKLILTGFIILFVWFRGIVEIKLANKKLREVI